MRRLLGGLLLAVLLFAPSAAAQTEPLEPTLALSMPILAERIPVDGNATNVTIPWAIDFLPGTTPPVGNTSLTLDIACVEPGISVLGPRAFEVAFAPATMHYEGMAQLNLVANGNTPGLVDLNCTVAAELAATPTTLATANSTAFHPQAAYYGLLEVKVPVKLKQAGPQKMIPYEVEITSFGNAPTMVWFELDAMPGGKWQAIIPDPILLEPEQTQTIHFTVATPYDTGWNNDEGTFTVLAKPRAAADGDSVGPDVQFMVLGRARGWYIPGPELPVLALVLVGTALVRRA